MPLTLEQTHTLMQGTIARARELDLLITVAVVDESGLLQALSRMDGAAPLSAQIAEAKAAGSAAWHRNGDQMATGHEQRPQLLAAVTQLTRLPIVPVDGSIVLRRDGVVVGAVGVSGATSAQDRDCAQAGVDTVLGT